MSVFRGGLEFMDRLGVFDVLLPFILVFTITFAFLEKTAVLGTEKDRVSGVEYPKKPLNSIISFVIAFFVVASTKLVSLISEFMANVVLLLLLSFSFLLISATFYTGEKDDKFKLSAGWKNALVGLTFASILLIFFNSMGWLTYFYDLFISSWDSAVTSTLIMIFLFVGIIFLVTYDSSPKSKEDK